MTKQAIVSRIYYKCNWEKKQNAQVLCRQIISLCSKSIVDSVLCQLDTVLCVNLTLFYVNLTLFSVSQLDTVLCHDNHVELYIQKKALKCRKM